MWSNCLRVLPSNINQFFCKEKNDHSNEEIVQLPDSQSQERPTCATLTLGIPVIPKVSQKPFNEGSWLLRWIRMHYVAGHGHRSLAPFQLVYLLAVLMHCEETKEKTGVGALEAKRSRKRWSWPSWAGRNNWHWIAMIYDQQVINEAKIS